MSPTFSPLTIKALADVVSGGGAYEAGEPVGVYRSGPKIEQLLLDCDLDLKIGNSSRVPALLDFLRALADEPDGHQGLARVVLRVADPRDYLSCPEKGGVRREAQHPGALWQGPGRERQFGMGRCRAGSI